MKKSVLLGLGTVALAGLLGKRYLDGQKANPNNLYDDYKEAIVGESGKFILKGLKGVAEGLSLGLKNFLARQNSTMSLMRRVLKRWCELGRSFAGI